MSIKLYKTGKNVLGTHLKYFTTKGARTNNKRLIEELGVDVHLMSTKHKSILKVKNYIICSSSNSYCMKQKPTWPSIVLTIFVSSK